MIILFITHYAGYYGANKSLMSVMQGLREKYGVQPLVLLPTEGPMCSALQEANIPYTVSHYYWWVNDNTGVFQWLLNKRKQVRNYTRVNRWVKTTYDLSIRNYGAKPDLVYTNSVCVNVGIFVAERLGVPHVWQFRESLSQFTFSLSLSRVLSLKLWGKKVNSRYVLISQYMMGHFRQYLPNDRMRLVYNGVDLPREVDRKENAPRDGVLRLAMVGLVSPQKNQLEAVKAVRLLRDAGIRVHLHIFGSCKDAYLSQLTEYIQEQGLEEMVHLEGHTNNVFERLRDMNIGIMASRDEAFGRVTIEYMLMKMPVIASRSGANEELMRDGKNGYLYDIDHPEQLAACIRRYVEQPELVEEQGKYAAQFAKENYSCEKNVSAIWQVIQEAINEKK